MTLLHLGLGLAGVACVAIPIVIHLLFRRRRKPILWGAMRFLLEAYRRQRRRLTLEQFLLLAARCLVVALLALAIGRPVLEAAGALGGGGARTLYVLIDNGLASSIRDDAGRTALERHKAAAMRLLQSLGPADRAGLMALGAPAESLVVPASADVSAVRGLVEGLEATDAPTDFSSAFERLRGELSSDSDASRTDNVIVAILSDFLTGSADIGTPPPGVFTGLAGSAGAGVRLLASRPAEDAPGNVQIVSVDPLRPVVLTGGEAATLASGVVTVRLRRTGPAVAEPGATTVRLRVVSASDGVGGAGELSAAAAQAVVRWAPGQSEATASPAVDLSAAAGGALIEAGGVALVAEIDRDALDGDNAHRRPVAVAETLRVGMVARRRFGGAPTIERLDPADWIRLALRPSDASPVDVIDIEPATIDAPSLAGLAAVVLVRPDLVDDEGWKRLRAFVDSGGMLLIFPPAEEPVHLWTDHVSETLGLPWRIAREAKEHDPPLALTTEGAASRLLSLVEEEAQDLASTVTVVKTLPIEDAPQGVETILRTQDGAPWAIAGSRVDESEETGDGAARSVEPRAERGLVVYFASTPTLSWTNLPARPFMVPLLNEAVRQGVGRAAGTWASFAGQFIMAPVRAVELRPVAGGAERGAILLDAAGRSAAPVRRAGLLRAVDGRGGSRGLLAVNADPDAGRTDVQAPAAVQSWLAATGVTPGAFAWIEGGDDPAADSPFAALAEAEARSPISLPLLIAALVIAMLEAVMARYFSHSFREEGGAGGVEGAAA